MSAFSRLARFFFGRGWGPLRTNLGLAAVSLALAFALWVFVTDTENPERTDFFAGAIAVEPVNVPQGLAVASLSDSSVSVRVRAPEDIWDELTTENFRVTVDLSGVSAREATVTVRVSVQGERSLKVVEVSPPRVQVVLEPVTTKIVPVRVKLVGAPPAGFEPTPARTRPEQVTASGPESLINLLAEAVADVNLTGLRVTLKQVVPLVPRDSRGGDIGRVVLEPATAEVELPIVQRELSLAYVVKPGLRGGPADGFNVSAVRLDPAFAVISGPIEILQSITELVTDEVDISGASSDVERVVRLRLPAGVRAEGGGEVTVHVLVTPALGEITVGLAPSLMGVGDGFTASLSLALVRVRVAGELPVLSGPTPGRLAAVVDVSGLGEGAHTVPLRVEAPAGVQVVSVEPATAV